MLMTLFSKEGKTAEFVFRVDDVCAHFQTKLGQQIARSNPILEPTRNIKR